MKEIENKLKGIKSSGSTLEIEDIKDEKEK